MGLEIVWVKTRACPVVVCDYCQRRIMRGADGNYEWDSEDEHSPLFFTHKDCSLDFRRLRRPEINSWGPLEGLPAFLLTNLKTTLKASEAAAEFLEGW